MDLENKLNNLSSEILKTDYGLCHFVVLQVDTNSS